MLNNLLKRIITITIFCMISVFTFIPVYAGTSNYDMTVSKSGSSSDDNKSLRTSKDGGSNYEAKYYVRPTYFSCVASKGKMRVHSIRYDYPNNSVSNELVISKANLDTVKSALYSYRVPYNEYYFLIAGYYSGTVNSIRSKGKYTP